MKDYTDDIELIEKFLGGVMSEEEKSRFENRRASDKEFNAMLKDMDLLVEGIKGSAAKSTKEEKLERLGFHSEIMRMEEDAQTEESADTAKRVIPLYRRPQFLALAAAIALLITLVPFYYEGPSNDKLFIKYFEPFDSPGSGTERGTNTISDKGKAYEAYDNGRYDEAVILFEDLLRKTDDPIIHLCLGNAQLQLGQLDKAEKSFNYVLTEHEDLVTPAKWYQALTYLKQNRMERAKSTLWQISKSSTYGEKAQNLLKDLD
jgi:tetratricopeptide (TPR) repeat protein